MITNIIISILTFIDYLVPFNLRFLGSDYDNFTIKTWKFFYYVIRH